MGKKFLILTVTILLVFSLMITPSFTQTYSRMITAWFNNLQVEVDGSLVNLKNEPFIYNNEVYVPIKELSDHVFFNFQHDSQSRTIKLRSNRNSDNIVNNYQNHFEVYNLRTQVTELQKEIELLQNAKFPYRRITNVEDMENYLREHFGKIENLPLSIRFRHIGGNKYTLSAVFPSDDLEKWNKLNRRDIENYVDDIFDVVRDLFNSKAEIEGDFRINAFNHGIRYANYWTRGNRLFFDFKLADQKQNQMVDGVKIANTLNQRLKYYHNTTFTYEVFVNQRDIDIVVAYNNNFSTWTPTLKMQYLKRLKEEVELIYDNINVNGRVLRGGNNGNVLRFSYEDNNIRSVDLLNDLEKHLNQYFKSFYYDGHDFAFSYRINEGYSGSLEITLVGNFKVTSTEWTAVRQHGEFAFRYFIQSGLHHIDTLFDADIFGNVVDRDLVSITSIEYYRESIYSGRTLQPIILE